MAKRALRRHPKPATALRCHDARHRLTRHTARRAATLPAWHDCCPIPSKATRRIPGQAKIAPSTTAPPTKSPLPSSSCHQQRQSTRLPPKPPLGQIPIDATPRTTARGFLPGGFRTPALRARANSCDGPASETLHRKPYTVAEVRKSPWCDALGPAKPRFRCGRVRPGGDWHAQVPSREREGTYADAALQTS